MRFANRPWFDVFGFAVLCGALAACAAHGGDDDSNNNQGGSGGTVASGSGGMVATGSGGTLATSGSGGMRAPGSGGMHGGGSGGMTASGSGGMHGTGGMGSDNNGSGGMTSDGGGSMAGDNQCVTDFTTDDPMTDPKCAACLCDKCNEEVTAMKGDAKATTLFDCGRTKNCTGFCCFCNSANCDLTNYAMGPCVPEVEMAAGAPSPSNPIVDGPDLQTACMTSGTSCTKPIVLAECMMKNCPTDCPPVTACN